ncbi:hypothetical protein EYZ11_012662 [Aspergillus tanneri]|uniref:Uncharacterized protein n=1 Tax=Aspergillus tanneri TaxID=1220188 RepID=A0A4S3J518_9EURO|nr:hypothetical protein EYZ11_012662 [Aspergillus tanneri]
MDTFINTIMRFLANIAQDPSLSSEQREQATYISISFFMHKNICRLMAQVTALTRGEVMIHPSHRINTLAEDTNTPARRHNKFLLPVITDHRITPTIADIEGHPIELISILDPAIERSLRGEKRLRFHQALLSMEKKANDDLARCTRKYGYHFIFRAGLQEYYMTFWRPDPRGDEYRVRAQKICYEAMEFRLRLDDAEKNVLVQATRCAPEDAYAFWDWLEKYRVSYRAMKTCLALLNKLENSVNR